MTNSEAHNKLVKSLAEAMSVYAQTLAAEVMLGANDAQIFKVYVTVDNKCRLKVLDEALALEGLKTHSIPVPEAGTELVVYPITRDSYKVLMGAYLTRV